jgi:hypothetical protein
MYGSQCQGPVTITGERLVKLLHCNNSLLLLLLLLLLCTRQTAGLGAIILLDCVTLLLATWLFLSPLEAMGKRIRGGQQVLLQLIHCM